MRDACLADQIPLGENSPWALRAEGLPLAIMIET